MAQTPMYRVRFVVEDAQFEECNGEPRPLTEEEYAENRYNRPDGSPMPYDEYRAYYGDPDRHVYLQSEVQRQCPCCQHWRTVGGTGYIDFMDDAPELSAVDRWYTEAEIAQIPGYLREIATADLADAKDEDNEAQS